MLEKARPAVVVVGVGRSGTSLVQAMLHAHPEIVFMSETHFFRQYVAPVLRRVRVKRAGPEKLMTILQRDEEFARANIQAEVLLEPFVNGSEPFGADRVYLRLLNLYRQRHDVRIVGDGDPRLVDFLPTVDRFVPSVRVIHMIRDPRDVLVSRRKAAWSQGRSDWNHILAYRAQMRRAKKTGPRFLGSRYLEIRYEDVLREPENTLDRICSHVEIAFDSNMLKFFKGADEIIGENEWQWKKETTRPLMRDNMRKWEGKLEPAVRMLVEKLCIEPFPELGYDPAKTAEAGGGGVSLKPVLPLAELLAKGFSWLYPLRTLAD